MSERSKKRLIGSMGASMTVAAILIMSIFSMSGLAGVFAPGIGGFEANFGKVYGDNAIIYPDLTADTAACKGVADGSDTGGSYIPVLNANVTAAKVKNVTFNKSFAAPDVITWDPLDNVTISITQRKNQTSGNYDNVTLKNLILKLNSLQADALRLSPNGRAYIYENYTNPSGSDSDGDKYIDPDNQSIYGYNGGFKIEAVDSQASPDYNDFYVKNGVTYAHLVAFGNIFFQNGVKISLHFDEPYANVASNSCAI